MKVLVDKDFRGLKAGTEYEFYFKKGTLDYVCVVGSNGCGKSSLMNAITGKYTEKKVGFGNTIVENGRIELSNNITILESGFEIAFGFDAAKEGSATLDTSFDASSYVDNAGFYADKKSHGEGEMVYLSNFIRKIKEKIIPDKTLICLDEFDKGFSLENQLRAKNLVWRFINEFNCQVIYSTHNPFLMLQSYFVYDFEDRCFIKSEEYLKEKTGYIISKYK